VSTYKHITGATKVHSDIEHLSNLPLLKNPYKALDNAYRCLIDDSGLDSGSVENPNLLTEKVDFGNGVWVYKYKPSEELRINLSENGEWPEETLAEPLPEAFYVPVFSRKIPNDSYSHWVIGGPVDSLPKALTAALAFIDCGFFTDPVAKAESNDNC